MMIREEGQPDTSPRMRFGCIVWQETCQFCCTARGQPHGSEHGGYSLGRAGFILTTGIMSFLLLHGVDASRLITNQPFQRQSFVSLVASNMQSHYLRARRDEGIITMSSGTARRYLAASPGALSLPLWALIIIGLSVIVVGVVVLWCLGLFIVRQFFDPARNKVVPIPAAPTPQSSSLQSPQSDGGDQLSQLPTAVQLHEENPQAGSARSPLRPQQGMSPSPNMAVAVPATPGAYNTNVTVISPIRPSIAAGPAQIGTFIPQDPPILPTSQQPSPYQTSATTIQPPPTANAYLQNVVVPGALNGIAMSRR